MANPAPRKMGLRSWKDRAADTAVLQKITCPHEVVYTSTGQPTEYKSMSVTFFVGRFLMVIAGEKDNIKPSCSSTCNS